MSDNLNTRIDEMLEIDRQLRAVEDLIGLRRGDLVWRHWQDPLGFVRNYLAARLAEIAAELDKEFGQRWQAGRWPTSMLQGVPQ